MTVLLTMHFYCPLTVPTHPWLPLLLQVFLRLLILLWPDQFQHCHLFLHIDLRLGPCLLNGCCLCLHAAPLRAPLPISLNWLSFLIKMRFALISKMSTLSALGTRSWTFGVPLFFTFISIWTFMAYMSLLPTRKTCLGTDMHSCKCFSHEFDNRKLQTLPSGW